MKNILVLFFASILLFSCNKDDDNTTTNPFIGKWEISHERYAYINNGIQGDWSNWNPTFFNQEWVFLNSNQMKLQSIDNVYQDGTYIYNENQSMLTITVPEAEIVNYQYTVTEINENEFVIENRYEYEVYQTKFIKIE